MYEHDLHRRPLRSSPGCQLLRSEPCPRPVPVPSGLAPVPVGLFLDGELVEIIDDQEDARGYLEELLRARFSIV